MQVALAPMYFEEKCQTQKPELVEEVCLNFFPLISSQTPVLPILLNLLTNHFYFYFFSFASLILSLGTHWQLKIGTSYGILLYKEFA